jgi:cell division septation protein DedD
MVTAAAAGLDLAAPHASVFGWVQRHAAAFAAGVAVMATIAAAAYAVTLRHTPAAAPQVAGLPDARHDDVAPGAVTPAPLAAAQPADRTDRTEPAFTSPVPVPRIPLSPTEASLPDAGQSTGTMGTAVTPQAAKYSVLVGSFRQESEAATLREQLQGLGYHVRTGRVASGDRGLWHQVVVGPYADVAQARQDEARVRQLPGYADAHLITR